MESVSADTSIIPYDSSPQEPWRAGIYPPVWRESGKPFTASWLTTHRNMISALGYFCFREQKGDKALFYDLYSALGGKADGHEDLYLGGLSYRLQNMQNPSASTFTSLVLHLHSASDVGAFWWRSPPAIDIAKVELALKITEALSQNPGEDETIYHCLEALGTHYLTDTLQNKEVATLMEELYRAFSGEGRCGDKLFLTGLCYLLSSRPREEALSLAKRLSVKEILAYFHINIVIGTSLCEALQKKESLFAQFLILCDAPLNITSNNRLLPVHLAASNNWVDILELLRTKGADLSAKTPWGTEAIHFAAESGGVQALSYLLSIGADINAKSPDGLTPLDFALEEKHQEASYFLLERGALPARGIIIVIQWAAANNWVDILTLLKSQGHNLFVKMPKGYEAIHIAASCGHIEALTYLLSIGADVNVKTPEGNTPLACAIKKRRKIACAFLVERKAEIRQRPDLRELTTRVVLRYMNLSDHSDDLTELVLSIKKIGHIANLKGIVRLSDACSVNLEGCQPYPFCRAWAQLLGESTILPKEPGLLLSEAFSFAANRWAASHEIKERVQSGKLSIFPTYSDSHTTSLIFYKNTMVFYNSQCKGALYYPFNPHKFIETCIEKIRDFNPSRDLSTLADLVSPDIPSPPSILLASILSRQKVGNCSYFSTRGTLTIALDLLGVAEIRSTSKELRIALLEQELERCKTFKAEARVIEARRIAPVIKAATAKLEKAQKKLAFLKGEPDCLPAASKKPKAHAP